MDIEKTFSNIGGTFLTPSDQIGKSLSSVRALIFDWDGVFNNGMKSGETGSPFSEIDSMGINLLRFSLWLRTGKLPLCFIITGMNNQTAAGFAKREHFDGIVMNLKRKKLAFDLICDSYSIAPDEVAFIFDDVIDIETARACGLSFFINRKSNPLLGDYIRKNKVCDYISASSGENHALREICELMMGLNGNYKKVIELRISFVPEYENYLKEREKIITNSELHP
jgi:3-deoxy-D-manno-octulosonate 8-phosphate phosphatase (KDO 8-P phosphatase)